jgi:hypothetical protein
MKLLLTTLIALLFFTDEIAAQVAVVTEIAGQPYEMYEGRERIAQFDDLGQLPDTMLSVDGIRDRFPTSVVVSSGDTIEVGEYIAAFEHTDLNFLIVSYGDATVIATNLSTNELVFDAFFGRNPITYIGGVLDYVFLYIGQGRTGILFDVTSESEVPDGFFSIPEQPDELWFVEGIDKKDLLNSNYPPAHNAVGVFDTTDGNYGSRVLLYSSDYLDQLVELSPVDPFWMQRKGYLPWTEYTRENATPFPTFFVDESRIDDPFFDYGLLTSSSRGQFTAEYDDVYEAILRIDIENQWVEPVWAIWGFPESNQLQKLHVFPEVGLVGSAYITDEAVSIDYFELPSMEYFATDANPASFLSTPSIMLLDGSTKEARELLSLGGSGLQQLPNGQEYYGIVPFVHDQFGEVVWRGEDPPVVDVNCNLLETDDPTDVMHSNSVTAAAKHAGSDTSIVLMSSRNVYDFRITAYLMIRGQPIGRILHDLSDKLTRMARWEEFLNGQHDIELDLNFVDGRCTVSVFNNQDYECSGLEWGEGIFAEIIWHPTDTFTVTPFDWFRAGVNGAMGSVSQHAPYGRKETIANAGSGGNGLWNDQMYLYTETFDGGHEPLFQGGVRNPNGFTGTAPEFFNTYHVGLMDTSQILTIDVDFVVLDSMQRPDEMWYLFGVDTTDADLPAGEAWCVNFDTASHIRPIWIRASDARSGFPLFLFRKGPIRPDDVGGLHTKFKNTRTILGLGTPTPVRENEVLEIGVYPNPSSGRVTLQTSFYEGFNYRVFDVTGQLVATGDVSGSSTYIELLQASGTYYVQALSRRGRIASGSIVITR